MLAAGLLWAAQSLEAAAVRGEVAADNAVTPVSYTTGSEGHQLKWLPTRPTAGQRLAQPAPLSRQERAVRPVAAEQPLELAPPAGSAMANPFGDKTSQAVPPALLSDKAVQGAQPTTTPNDLMIAPLNPPGTITAQPTAQPETPSAQSNNAPSEVPSLEEELAVAPQLPGGECKSPKELLKPIRKIDYKTAPEPGDFPPECSLGNDRFVPRSWNCTTFAWTASSLCHKPLYFEQVQLERYGHSWGPLLQPVLSGAHFFLTIPALPYLMGVYPPNECIYTLGYYRPGNCAPYLLDPIPLSVRGALYEGGVATGLAFLIP